MTRTFQSPPGRGVYLSILLRPKVLPEALMGVTGMTAVAVCNAVERAAGVRPQIAAADLPLHQGVRRGGEAVPQPGAGLDDVAVPAQAVDGFPDGAWA